MKEVRIKYWKNGVKYIRVIPASEIESWKKALHWAGCSGIKVLKGKTKGINHASKKV